MKRKMWIAGVGFGVAVAGGSLLVATVSPIGLAGAQDEADTSEEAVAEADAPDRRSGHDVLGEVLDELVAKGTIDQSDADAVEEAMEDRRAEFRASRPDRDGRGHGRRGHRPYGGEELLEALDMNREELRDALADGQTIEDLAEAAGVDLAEIANQRLDQAQARLDEAIADGSITDERAARAQEHIDEAREAAANGEFAFPGRGRGHARGPADLGGDDGEE
jgi:polyhydroxyalkanoate synthesis regulator phasin